MLIKKSTTVAVGDIVSLKLINGDELVGKVADLDTINWYIERPCVVVPTPNGLRLIQALLTADPDQTFALSKSHVMLIGQSIDDVNAHYLQTTTGIQPVTAGGLIKP